MFVVEARIWAHIYTGLTVCSAVLRRLQVSWSHDEQRLVSCRLEWRSDFLTTHHVVKLPCTLVRSAHIEEPKCIGVRVAPFVPKKKRKKKMTTLNESVFDPPRSGSERRLQVNKAASICTDSLCNITLRDSMCLSILKWRK
jgi:hypothetical protein